MINAKVCEWLLENADAPIRYRVLCELLRDEKAAKELEDELIANPVVGYWLKKLDIRNTSQRPNICEMAHGSPDFHLENSMQKIVQLGLHAAIPSVAKAVWCYREVFQNIRLKKPYRKDAIGHYHGQDLCIPANMLVMGGFRDDPLLAYMLGSLDEMYEFAQKGDCNIYLSAEERAALKGVPPNWTDIKHFTKPELFAEHGIGWPMIYDIVGLTKLYGTHAPDTDRKIDAVIAFVSTDDFHNTIPDGYGILITDGKTRYKGHGWDPKYPGWFGVSEYIDAGFVPKLLYYAMVIVKYPIARKTVWFSQLIQYLDRYKTDRGTYIFPKEWLVEKQGCAVLGNHMSFGENRRKKNWCETESTFYMQLLCQNM